MRVGRLFILQLATVGGTRRLSLAVADCSCQSSTMLNFQGRHRQSPALTANQWATRRSTNPCTCAAIVVAIMAEDSQHRDDINEKPPVGRTKAPMPLRYQQIRL